MEKSSKQLIKEWQGALQSEIAHLKKYGSNKYYLLNGRRLTGNEDYTYYFDCRTVINIPNGSSIKVQWGHLLVEGRILSSEGKSVIVQLDKALSDDMSEAYLMYDPWQLLEELSLRLADMKKSKLKRSRMMRLMYPTMEAKHNSSKNDSKVKELFTRAKYNPVTFVWGPPGTGKTYTLARVAANLYIQKKKVLVLAQSNAAVDVLMTEIHQFLNQKQRFKEGDILRYGSNHTMQQEGVEITLSYLLEKTDPDLIKQKEQWLDKKQLLKLDLQKSFSTRDSEDLLKVENKIAAVLEKMKRKEQELLKDAEVIGTTLARAAMDANIYENEYDMVIVDEASMCYVPQAAFAASLGKRVIICGDFKQLPPIAQSNGELVVKWLKNDIFHASQVAENVSGQKLHPHLLLLNEQRRMHPDISAFTNKHVYLSLVSDHKSVKNNRQMIIESQPFANQASIYLDTSSSGHYCINEKMSKSRWNPWHLLLSFQVIHEAIMNKATSIGYVTPYRVQADMMNVLLDDFYPNEKLNGSIMAATVHKFQGSEREIVVFDTVDSWPQDRPGMLLVGKDSERLINVAITRTKGKFVHINNRMFTLRNVSAKRTVHQLVQYQTSHHQIVTHQQIGTWIKNQDRRMKWIHAIKMEEVFLDILHAKKSIIISLPAVGQLPVDLKEIIDKSKAKLTIISENIYMPAHRTIVDSLPFPFIMIDQNILWLGQPYNFLQGVKPPLVAVRLESEVFCGQFLAHLPIEETI